MSFVVFSYNISANEYNLLYYIYTAVKEPVFWAGVNDQLLSTTLDKNSALLIDYGVNTWDTTKLKNEILLLYLWILFSSKA